MVDHHCFNSTAFWGGIYHFQTRQNGQMFSGTCVFSMFGLEATYLTTTCAPSHTEDCQKTSLEGSCFLLRVTHEFTSQSYLAGLGLLQQGGPASFFAFAAAQKLLISFGLCRPAGGLDEQLWTHDFGIAALSGSYLNQSMLGFNVRISLCSKSLLAFAWLMCQQCVTLFKHSFRRFPFLGPHASHTVCHLITLVATRLVV